MSDLVFMRNCCVLRMFQEKPSWCRMNRSVREGKKERSNGLDNALYKNYLYLFLLADSYRVAANQPAYKNNLIRIVSMEAIAMSRSI